MLTTILNIGRDILTDVMLPALATVLAGYAVAFLKKALERWQIKLTMEQEERLRQLAKDAVLRVEEMAAQVEKTGNVISAGSKLTMAVNEVQSRIGKQDVTREEAASAVESALPTVGLGATFPKPEPFPRSK